MATVTHGADPDKLQALAAEFTKLAETLVRVGRDRAADLGNLRWSGPDAERMRGQWSLLFLHLIYPTANAVTGAGQATLANAQQQRDVSSAGGTAATPDAAPSASPGTPAVTGGPTGESRSLLDRLAAIAGVLAEAPEIATIITAARRWTNGLERYDLATKALEVSGGFRVAAAGVTIISAGMDANELGEAARAGDGAGVVRPLVSLGLTAAGVAGSSVAGAAGVAWSVGSFIGDEANDAMQGTQFQQRLQRYTDPMFEHAGAAGMLGMPVALLAATIETGIDAVTDD